MALLILSLNVVRIQKAYFECWAQHCVPADEFMALVVLDKMSYKFTRIISMLRANDVVGQR